MRVLIDTNVVLDFLQDREHFSENAAKLFEKIDAGKWRDLLEQQQLLTSTTLSEKQQVW
jgi:predicted nucleic acid-binding protein